MGHFRTTLKTALPHHYPPPSPPYYHYYDTITTTVRPRPPSLFLRFYNPGTSTPKVSPQRRLSVRRPPVSVSSPTLCRGPGWFPDEGRTGLPDLEVGPGRRQWEGHTAPCQEGFGVRESVSYPCYREQRTESKNDRNRLGLLVYPRNPVSGTLK